MIIDSIDNKKDVLIGRDIRKINLPIIETSPNNISQIIDELCKNIGIE